MTAWLRAWWSRLTAGLALLVVASVTGVISYTHVYDLTVSLHQPAMVARLMPFGVDGLIVVGSVFLLQAAPGQTWLGWLGVVPGVAASLFANVESGLRWGPLAAGWAGVPAASAPESHGHLKLGLLTAEPTAIKPVNCRNNQCSEAGHIGRERHRLVPGEPGSHWRS